MEFKNSYLLFRKLEKALLGLISLFASYNNKLFPI